VSCQLIVSGRRFDPRSFLERVQYRGAEVRLRGVSPPGVPRATQTPKVSMFRVWIGQRNFGPLAKQVAAAERFLRADRNQRLLSALRGYAGIEEATLEFGIRWEAVVVHGDRLPARLVSVAGTFGLTIVITHYPVDDYS
jgi:hypothetical protein